MIKISTKLVYKLVINATSINLMDAFLISCYTAFKGVPSKLFYKSKGYTLRINLKQSEEEILKGFKSNTRNEVRRGIKDGYTIREITDIGAFVDYYNNFAIAKGLPKISLGNVMKYPNLIIFSSELNGVPLTMHANFVDSDEKEAALLYSASIRLSEDVDRKSIGISNRFLHYMEFLEFKKKGLEVYDFSGVCEDPDNHEEYSIGQFKKGFGGDLTERYTLYSYPMLLLLIIKKIFIR